MASPNVIELTEGNWNEHVTSGTLVVADFWAPWCGPCRALSPAVDRIADQFAGKVKVGKLNVDENPNIAVKYDVMTIPRILFFKGSDTPVHQEVGVLGADDLAKLIAQYQ
jgi:thioredoxin 1